MKNRISVVVAILMMTGIISTIFASEKPISIKVDGKEAMSDVAPYINAHDRTMVPVGFLSENLGCKVKWEAGDIVAVENSTTRIVFTIGDYTARVTDLETNAVRLAVSDARPVWKEDEVMVPLRFISEELNVKVDWDDASRQVSILADEDAASRSQAEFQDRTYVAREAEKRPEDPEIPFELEYLDITKQEVEDKPVLQALSQLPNCSSISKRISGTTQSIKYRFTFQEVNTHENYQVSPIFYFDLNSDFSAMSFWLERNNSTTLELLKRTLDVLFKEDKGFQDMLYQQVVTQRTSPVNILNTAVKDYIFSTEKTESSNWGDEAFNIKGTVYRLR